MNAYYYGFDPTGYPAIDKILSAVACAGKAFHGTDEWTDSCSWEPEGHVGETPVEWIQNAANEAAESFRPAPQPRQREPGEPAPCVLRIDCDGCPIAEDLEEMESVLYWRPEHLKSDVRSFIEYMGKASPCATVRREPFPGEDEPMLYFATGGWSGNEEFIDRLLAAGKPRGFVRLLFLHGWARGGAYWFDVLDEGDTDAD